MFGGRHNMGLNKLGFEKPGKMEAIIIQNNIRKENQIKPLNIIVEDSYYSHVLIKSIIFFF